MLSSYTFDPCELLPVQACDVAQASRSDEDNSLAMSYIVNTVPSSLSSFRWISLELNIKQGCLLRGSRVIIPQQFWSQLLEVLLSHSKPIMRASFWWPGLDQYIVNLIAGSTWIICPVKRYTFGPTLYNSFWIWLSWFCKILLLFNLVLVARCLFHMDWCLRTLIVRYNFLNNPSLIYCNLSVFLVYLVFW